MTQSEQKSVPGPHFLETERFLLHFRRDPLSAFQQINQQYGDVVHFQMGKQHAYLLSHPDDIRDVLVVHHQDMHKPQQQRQPLVGNGLLRSEGEFHRRQRRLIQPAFHRQRIASYGQTMVEYTQRANARWQDGMQCDMSEEMMALTLAIAGQTMFGADVEGDAQTVRQALTTIMELNSMGRSGPLDDLLDQLPLPRNKRRSDARAQLDAVVYRMIEERHRSGEEHSDLLSMLLMARDVEGDGSGMTDEQLRDEVMTLFIAGHETTANALSWTWYLLAQHREVEEKLRRELTDVLAGRAATVEDVPNLHYMEMVLSEVMRLYPPAWTIARRVIKDYQIREYAIPEGSLIIMSQYVVHHDSRWYPDPFHFDPERWTPEARASRPKYAYFPFGGGPRLCIGEPFAWMEASLVLATLLPQWHAQLRPGHQVGTEPLITLRPKGGVPMTLHKI